MKSKFKTLTTILAACLLILLFSVTSTAASKTAAPQKVKLSKISSSAENKVTISWTKAKNATNYRIYYKVPGGSWKNVADVSGTKSSYTHRSNSKARLSAGTKYIYTVRAYNRDSKKWGTYDTKGLTVITKKAAAKIPGKVKLGKAAVFANKVTITWSKAANATNYRIYYKEYGKSWTSIADVDANKTSYTHVATSKFPLKNGIKYAYTVRAYNKGSGKWGTYDTKGLTVTAKVAAAAKVPSCAARQIVYLTDEIKYDVDSGTMEERYGRGLRFMQPNRYIFIKNLDKNAIITDIRTSNPNVVARKRWDGMAAIEVLTKNEIATRLEDIVEIKKRDLINQVLTVSFKVTQGGKTYPLSCRITVKPMESPFESFKIGSVDIVKFFPEYYSDITLYRQTWGKQKITYKAASGYVIDNVYYSRDNKRDKLSNGTVIDCTDALIFIRITYHSTRKPANYNPESFGGVDGSPDQEWYDISIW